MVVSIWGTNNCNMKCDYCYEGEKGIFSLSIKDYKYVEEFICRAKEISGEDSIYIKFFGGEPLLNFKFIEYFVENFKESDVIYSITTNGTLLTGEILDFLIDKNIEISVSVDGEKEIHDRHRKLKNGVGSWELIEKNLVESLKKSESIRIRMTYTPETVSSLADSVLKLSEMGAKSVYLLPDYFSEEWDLENFTILERELKKIQDLRKTIPRIEIVTGNYKETLNKECSKCGGGENTFSITAEGEIYPCTYAVGIERFKLGSIYDLKKIKWGSYSIDSSLRSSCKDCKYFKTCYSGRCIYLNYKMTGNLYIPNGFFCSYQKMEYRLAEEERYG